MFLIEKDTEIPDRWIIFIRENNHIAGYVTKNGQFLDVQIFRHKKLSMVNNPVFKSLKEVKMFFEKRSVIKALEGAGLSPLDPNNPTTTEDNDN